MSNQLAAFLYCRGLVEETLPLNEICQLASPVRASLDLLVIKLDCVTEDMDEQEIQSIFYDAGKLHFADNLRWWFKILYQILLKQNEGPRFGQFTKIVTACWVQDSIRLVINDYWNQDRKD